MTRTWSRTAPSWPRTPDCPARRSTRFARDPVTVSVEPVRVRACDVDGTVDVGAVQVRWVGRDAGLVSRCAAGSAGGLGLDERPRRRAGEVLGALVRGDVDGFTRMEPVAVTRVVTRDGEPVLDQSEPRVDGPDVHVAQEASVAVGVLVG